MLLAKLTVIREDRHHPSCSMFNILKRLLRTRQACITSTTNGERKSEPLGLIELERNWPSTKIKWWLMFCGWEQGIHPTWSWFRLMMVTFPYISGFILPEIWFEIDCTKWRNSIGTDNVRIVNVHMFMGFDWRIQLENVRLRNLDDLENMYEMIWKHISKCPTAESPTHQDYWNTGGKILQCWLEWPGEVYNGAVMMVFKTTWDGSQVNNSDGIRNDDTW